jgi:hypothetical protein
MFTRHSPREDFLTIKENHSMFAIIDWMTFGFVVIPESGSVMTWNSKEEAERYAEEELQTGLWKVIEVPPFAQAFKP